jgi:hypothetical protein
MVRRALTAKAHRQQRRQQQHTQAVLDQHVGGHLRTGLLEQAGFLRLDLGEQIGFQGRQALALIRRREGRGLDGGELVLELDDAAGALHRLAELSQAGLLHPPGAISERLGRFQTPPGGQTLEGKQQQKAQHHQA